MLRQTSKILFLLILLTTAASAELRIEITEGLGSRTPVAIVPFGWEGRAAGMPAEVHDVISANLARSGRFEPIPEDDMLQKPTSSVDVDFDDWSILGVEAVVIGKVVQTGDNAYQVQFRLFDVFAREQLVGYQMPATRGTMRRAAHRAADMIYEKLTGIKGVFDTRVAFVTAERQSEERLYRLVIADQDGENESVILESSDPIMSPAWSPDSRRGGALVGVRAESENRQPDPGVEQTGNQRRTVVFAGRAATGADLGRPGRQPRHPRA